MSNRNKPVYYTDPILYKEGFFENQSEELEFLKKVELYNQKQKRTSKDKKKRIIQ